MYGQDLSFQYSSLPHLDFTQFYTLKNILVKNSPELYKYNYKFLTNVLNEGIVFKDFYFDR
ncbi:hypothetical protein MmazTMA_20380 [Methanosarcina mazei]|nr:hypothetical protein MmazTMA_20380 [Methanosarcina mazei]